MGRKSRKLNNQGSTLITVVIVIAFIGILGSMMLSVTMTNLQMKIIESKSKENFYSCEVAMEEIRTGIEELTAKQIQFVYENNIMTNFATFLDLKDPITGEPEDEAGRNSYVRKLVAASIIKEIGDATGYSDDQLTNGTAVKKISIEAFTVYLSAPPTGVSITVTVGTDEEDTPIYSMTGDTVVIEDICVRMTKNDYETSITSDIVITLPEFTFDEGSEDDVVYRMDQPFQNYALIADGNILSSHNTIAETGNTVNGNVYAGTGITVSGQNMGNHTLYMNSTNIVTRGNIKAVDTGKLEIKGPGLVPSVIWADGLQTYTTQAYVGGVTRNTSMNINGVCFIKDDLTLDAVKSSVKITGAYVGYSGEHTAKGSSIIINGRDSSMNLSGLDSLILAGRAHVSVYDVLKETDILTGESVAFKSNQRAYLIPGKFMEGIYHNPITVKDTETIDPSVNFDSLDPMVDLSYPTYIDAANPYKVASKQTVTGTSSSILRYYYLNFASGMMADLYLQNYVTKYPTALNVTDPFSLVTVELPDPAAKEVVTAGNRMSYDGLTVSLESGKSNDYSTDAELDNAISTTALDDPIYNAASLPIYEVGLLSELHSKISHLLYLDSTRAYLEGDKTVKSAVIPDGVDFIGSQYATEPDPDIIYRSGSEVIDSSDLNPAKPSFIVVDGDVTLSTDIDGLVVASGNITISNGVEINGMVVAVGSDASESATGGNIIVGDSVTVNGRLVAVKDITLGIGGTFNAVINSPDDEDINEIFENEGKNLQNLFKYAAMSVNFTIAEPADLTVDLSSMISYENWRKN